MEKIALSKNEKKVFRMVMNGVRECPKHFPSHKFIPSLRTLEEKGLIKVTWVQEDTPWVFAPTKKGRSYISENPNLSNPIDWAVITGVISILGLVTSIIAIFVGCSAYIHAVG